MKNGTVIETPCILCAKTVRRNGVPQTNYTILTHRFSPGEAAYVCDECRVFKAERYAQEIGESGNWNYWKKMWCDGLQT